MKINPTFNHCRHYDIFPIRRIVASLLFSQQVVMKRRPDKAREGRSPQKEE